MKYPTSNRTGGSPDFQGGSPRVVSPRHALKTKVIAGQKAFRLARNQARLDGIQHRKFMAQHYGLLGGKLPFTGMTPKRAAKMVLRIHPGLRMALNLYDFMDYNPWMVSPPEVTFPPGWQLCCDTGERPMDTYQHIGAGSTCSTFYCGLNGQVPNGQVSDGINGYTTHRRFLLGKRTSGSPTQTPYRHRTVQMWFLPFPEVHASPEYDEGGVKTLPKNEPLGLTDFMPSLDPLTRPGRFLPTPLPLPVRLVTNRPIRTDTDETTQTGPDTKTDPKPLEPELPHSPPGYVRERKFMGPWARAVFAIWSAATETPDLVEAFYDALPDDLKCPGARTIDQKAKCFIDAMPELFNDREDFLVWLEVVENLAYNYVEDYVAGTISRKLNDAGLGSGFGGTPYVKQNFI